MAEAEEALIPQLAQAQPREPKALKPRRLTDIITAQLEALRAYHRAVLDTDDIEAVHKMRVTTRRLQASLDLLENQLNVRGLKSRLRTWRRALSRVRNYDVFLELIQKEEPARGRARKEQLQLIKGILQERRVRRAAKVRRFLAGADINRIAVKLGLLVPARSESNIVVEPDTARSIETNSIEYEMGSMNVDEGAVASYAAERLDQRFAEFQALVAGSHPTNDPAELHQLRIAAKRVRYLLEIVSQMGFGDASKALLWLRTLQDRIGDWHDLEALEEEIITIVSSREFTKKHLAESSRMLQAAAHLQKKKDALVKRLFPVRMPRHIAVTSHRIARALRRASVQSDIRASKPSEP
jgi:CHAD domain-containing protein